MFDPLDWSWFAVSAVSSVFWFAILRRGLRRVTDHECPPANARTLTFATITMVSAMLLGSSLLYADVITQETGRWLLSVARVALLAGGITVWWTGRRMA